MIISTYYNSVNKTMMLTSVSNVDKQTQENNVVKFYNDEKLVGMNIFDVEYNGGTLIDVTTISEAKEFGEVENPFIYAKIEKIEDHPKSTKLHICTIFDGTNTHQIVCGAANVEENKVVVMAKIGAVLPGGMEIKPAKVIDIDSSGMLCSYKELGINIEATGIILKDDLTLVGETYLGE